MPSHDPEDDHLLPTGYRLEEFEIVRVLGEGGFGIAYLAFDHTLRQQRVIKEFLPGQVARRDRSGLRITARTGQENRDIFSDGLRSFISEARLLASMDHPNVVRVYRCLEANGTAYLVMHYYEGQTLKQRLEALNGARPEADWVLRLLSAVLRGLQIVHGHGILHRDLKPDNLYLLADDRPVLIDFGAARRVVGGRTKALTGVITEGYSPIEQYIGDGGLQEGPWTDLYALGATGYWLVSGRKPWNAVMRMAGDRLTPAVALGQDLYPPTLLASLDRALAIQPQERYPSAAEWLAALEDPTARVSQVRRRPVRRSAPVIPPAAELPAAPPPPPTPAPVPPPPAPRPAAPAARQSFEPELVRLPGGCFQMGSPASEAGRDSDERQHRVCVEAFEIGKYEVTQGEWQAVMGNNPSRFKHSDRHPVEQVSWNDVQDYLQRLNQRTGKIYRLPTEAEWEYAARAGTTTPFWTGRCVTTQQANYDGNNGYSDPDCGAKTGNYRQKTMPVGSFPANPWGLYDTMGNVWEWTCSLYDKDYNGAETICIYKMTSGPRSLRGGSWFNRPARVRSASRDTNTPTNRGDDTGFRLARSL